MRLRQAERLKGREVLVALEVDKGWANRSFIAVFEDGEFIEAASVADLVCSLLALGFLAEQVRVEVIGDCALSDEARTELLHRFSGDSIPAFLWL
jgi:hypothetical protein